MEELKKNELNEQEMENIAGGRIMGGSIHRGDLKKYAPSDEEVEEAIAEAIDTVSEAADTAWKVVKHVLDDMF